MNKVQIRATNRIAAIAYSRARIEKKIAGLPNDARIPAWRERLRQYDVSIKALNLELEIGRPMRISGGVSVEPGLGRMKAGGVL